MLDVRNHLLETTSEVLTTPPRSRRSVYGLTSCLKTAQIRKGSLLDSDVEVIHLVRPIQHITDDKDIHPWRTAEFERAVIRRIHNRESPTLVYFETGGIQPVQESSEPLLQLSRGAAFPSRSRGCLLILREIVLQPCAEIRLLMVEVAVEPLVGEVAGAGSRVAEGILVAGIRLMGSVEALGNQLPVVRPPLGMVGLSGLL